MKSFFGFLLALLVSGALSAQAQTAQPMGSTPPASSAAKMKADGTPDMRYKQNKMMPSSAPAGKMKKDGTPDMRYKANQTTTTTKTKM